MFFRYSSLPWCISALYLSKAAVQNNIKAVLLKLPRGYLCWCYFAALVDKMASNDLVRYRREKHFVLFVLLPIFYFFHAAICKHKNINDGGSWNLKQGYSGSFQFWHETRYCLGLAKHAFISWTFFFWVNFTQHPGWFHPCLCAIIAFKDMPQKKTWV